MIFGIAVFQHSVVIPGNSRQAFGAVSDSVFVRNFVILSGDMIFFDGVRAFFGGICVSGKRDSRPCRKCENFPRNIRKVRCRSS